MAGAAGAVFGHHFLRKDLRHETGIEMIIADEAVGPLDKGVAEPVPAGLGAVVVGPLAARFGLAGLATPGGLLCTARGGVGAPPLRVNAEIVILRVAKASPMAAQEIVEAGTGRTRSRLDRSRAAGIEESNVGER